MLEKKRICFSSQFFIQMSLKNKTLNPLIGFQRAYALKKMEKFKKMFDDNQISLLVVFSGININ